MNVSGRDRMITVLVTDLISVIVEFLVSGPGRLMGGNRITGALRSIDISYTVKDVEFILGTDDHLICNSQFLQITYRLFRNIARVLVERVVIRFRDDHHIADHGQRRYFSKWIDNGGIQVRYENHIAFFQRSISVVGAVETDAVCHGFFCEAFRRNTEMTPSATDIGHLEINHANSVVLAELLNFRQCCHIIGLPIVFCFRVHRRCCAASG